MMLLGQTQDHMMLLGQRQGITDGTASSINIITPPTISLILNLMGGSGTKNGPDGRLQVQCPVYRRGTLNLRNSNHLKWAATCLSFALERDHHYTTEQ